METFVAHHKSPINEYDYLAVRVGLNATPVVLIDGRQCYVSGETRVNRARQCRTAYNAIFVRFLDDGSVMRLTGTEFNKRAKNAPLREPK